MSTMSRSLGRLALLLGAVAALGLVPPVQWAEAADAPCAEILPDLVWESIERESVVVGAAGVEQGIVTRMADVAHEVSSWLTADLGPQPRYTVCLVGADQDDSGLQLIPAGQQLNSIVLADRHTVVTSTRLLRLVEPAIGFGMAYNALWDFGRANGLAGYPEPLGSTVAQWYSTRVTGRQALHHAAMRGANFFETESQIAWTAGTQSDVVVFNQDYNESPLDDIVEYAVATRGIDILRDLDGANWETIEAEWRTELRFELTGRRTPTTGWITGLAMVIALAIATVTVAWLGRRRRRTSTSRGST